MTLVVDNLTESEKRRRQLILQVQELYQAGTSTRRIAQILGKDRKTIKKYTEGDPDKLCRSNKHSSLSGYDDWIIEAIRGGYTQSDIARQLAEDGYAGTISNVRQYVTTLAKRHGLEISKYCRTAPKDWGQKQRKPKMDYITRKGIFNHLWMNMELSSTHKEYLWEEYPILRELEACIRHFREFFNKRNMPMLHLFTNRYGVSNVKELASFANGLQKDINAVENAVASPLSNGFVEGTNSKVKTIKKSMYGRCGIELLSAKLMYNKYG